MQIAGDCLCYTNTGVRVSRRREVIVDGRRKRTLSEGSEEVPPGPHVVEGEGEQAEPVNE